MVLNLYNILLENIDCNQLIEEGKDPVEVLHYKFQNVPSDIIDSIIAIDPTKKKSYSQWTLGKWGEEEDTITKALKDGRLEKLFQFFKEHQEKQIKDCPSVHEGLDAYVPKEKDTVLDKSDEPETYVLMLGCNVPSELANDFDIIFNEDNWLIAVPNTYEASCKLGENCWWCTANHFGNGEGYYNQYLRQGGKYYINFDLSKGETLDDRTRKEYPYTRYQFHFESNQFKAATRGEPEVSLDDLNIPESAIDFYHSINEDYDIGEMSEEEKMDRYYDQRWDDNIYINDDLYLNVEFDDYYDYHEPDLENDSWYLYNRDGDDRDPLSYTAVDPHDDNIVYNTEKVVVLKQDGGDGYVIAYQTSNRWSRWEAEDVDNYLPLEKYEDILFFLSDGGYRSPCKVNAVINGELMTEKLLSSDAKALNTEMFINHNFDDYENTYCFLEIVLPEGYHSLMYLTDGDFQYLIHKDKPINGKCYEIVDREHEDYTIHGVFRDYNLWDIFNGEDTIDYYLEEELPNGNYLVVKSSKEISSYGVERENNLYNVLDKETRELIFNSWHENIVQNGSGYVVTDNKKSMQFGFDGQPLFEGQYTKVLTLVDGSGILAGINDEYTDLLDANSGEQIIRLKKIDTSHKPKNNCIIVQTYGGELGDVSKVYNYGKRDFEWNDTLWDDPIFSFGSSFVVCSKGGEDTLNVLRDYGDPSFGEIEIKGWTRDHNLDGFKIWSSDKKQNILLATGFILPDWCDNILLTNYAYKFVLYENNNKYYYYNVDSKEFEINPNGFDYQPIDNIYHYGQIRFQSNDGIDVFYNPRTHQFEHWRNGVDGQGSLDDFPDDATKQRVMNFIAELTGENQEPIEPIENNEQVPSMAEQFKRMLNRIDEARRLNFMDLYD